MIATDLRKIPARGSAGRVTKYKKARSSGMVTAMTLSRCRGCMRPRSSADGCPACGRKYGTAVYATMVRRLGVGRWHYEHVPLELVDRDAFVERGLLARIHYQDQISRNGGAIEWLSTVIASHRSIFPRSFKIARSRVLSFRQRRMRP